MVDEIYQQLEGLNPLENGTANLYELIVREHKNGVPASIVGKPARDEMGKLVEERDGKIYPDKRFIAHYYETEIRDAIQEAPYLAAGVIFSAFEHAERLGPCDVGERIMYGLFRAIREPVPFGNEQVEITISVNEETKKFIVDASTTAKI